MTIRDIFVVVEPPRSVLPSSPHGRPRDGVAACYGELADAMRLYAKAKVEVVQMKLCDAPQGGLVVRSSGYDVMMEEIPSGERTALAQRTILLDVDRSVIMSVLERYGFAGAVERQRWLEWRTERHKETGSGLVTRRELAGAIGARSAAEGPFSSGQYSSMGSELCSNLPELIVRCLDACIQG